MGLVIQASVLCDNCSTTREDLVSIDAPMPAAWMTMQGYANVSDGSSAAILGYFCPGCVDQQGTRALVQKAVDLTPDLTALGNV